MQFTFPGSHKNPIDVVQVSVEGTTSSAIVSGASVFHGLVMETDGINDVTFAVYNGTSAAGTLITTSSLKITGSDNWNVLDSVLPIGCANGIYVDVTCSGTYKYMVYYDDGTT